MKRLAVWFAVFGGLMTPPVWAALKPGDAAPDFTAQAAVGGKDFKFSLSDALKRGPVVLYFYPKSFTRGCTIEAHEFAEAAASFAEAGATLIGMSKTRSRCSVISRPRNAGTNSRSPPTPPYPLFTLMTR